MLLSPQASWVVLLGLMWRLAAVPSLEELAGVTMKLYQVGRDVDSWMDSNHYCWV